MTNNMPKKILLENHMTFIGAEINYWFDYGLIDKPKLVILVLNEIPDARAKRKKKCCLA